MMELMPKDESDKGSEKLKAALNAERRGLLLNHLRRRMTSLNDAFFKKIRTEKQHSFAGFLESLKGTEVNSSLAVMASMIPDEIISQWQRSEMTTFDGAVMFTDISGFTDLSEKYSSLGHGGASRLSIVLNKYLGNMILEILSHGGDIIKFSGDALLVIFKETAYCHLNEAIHKALDTAIIIQKNYSSHKTDVGVRLYVKIAISAGTMVFSNVNAHDVSQYILVGDPIWDVKSVEKLCNAGDIVTTISTFSYVNKNEYQFSVLADNTHYKILGFSELWKSVIGKSYMYVDDIHGSATGPAFPMKNKKKLKNDMRDLTTSSFSTNILRPALEEALPHKEMVNYLKRFMIPPLMRSITIQEPIEYLTELRQIVVVFVNIISSTMESLQLVKFVQRAYQKIIPILNHYNGILNKISLFDKDIVFLIVFGLRGYKSVMEAQSALKCAAEIRQSVTTIPYLTSISIGITTGVSYCGVVGHALRREYSVISVSVNQAARLMIAYPHKVTCDRETFLNSKLDLKHFILQPAIKLKGLANTGPIYEFREKISPVIIKEPIDYYYPIVGRNDDIQHYLNAYKSVLLNRRTPVMQRNKLPEPKVIKYSLTYIGFIQIGKTRFINEIFSILHIRHELTVRLTLNEFLLKKPLSTAKYIVLQLLNSESAGTTSSIQSLLLNYISQNLKPYADILNILFNVHFPSTSASAQLTKDQIIHTRKMLLEAIILKAISSHTLTYILIDDFHYADSESVELMAALLSTKQLFYVLTVCDDNYSVEKQELFDHPLNEIKRLPPVDRTFHCALACQFLDVVAIPLELERFLHTYGKCTPGWMQGILQSLVEAKEVVPRAVHVSEAIKLGLVFDEFSETHQMRRRSTLQSVNELKLGLTKPKYADDDILKHWEEMKFSFVDSNHENVKADFGYKDDVYIRVAFLSHAGMLNSMTIELESDSLHLIIYDKLSPFEQLICKCASVIRDDIRRNVLSYIMNPSSNRLFAIGIQRLFELGVFGCASKGRQAVLEVNSVVEDSSIRHSQKLALALYCNCEKLSILADGLPIYAQCRYLKFLSKPFSQTIYNLLTLQQIQEFHNRALLYLKQKVTRCVACGGGFFSDVITSQEYPTGRYENYEVEYDFLRSRKKGEFFLAMYGDGESKPKKKVRRIASLVLLEKEGTEITEVFDFSQVDYSACQCVAILTSMYEQLMIHLAVVNDNEKLIEAICEFTEFNYEQHNVNRSRTLLIEATRIWHETKFKDNLVRDSLKGRIYTLEAKCCFSLGLTSNAKALYREALKSFQYPFPRNDWHYSRRWMSSIYKIKCAFKNERKNIERIDPLLSRINDEISKCFVGMYELYRAQQVWKLAEAAATESLIVALNYRRPLLTILDAIRTVLCYASRRRKHSNVKWLYVKAMSLALTLKNKPNLEIIYIITLKKLYLAMVEFSATIQDSKNGIQMGYIALNAGYQSIMSDDHWRVVPYLYHFLMDAKKINQVISLLIDLKEIALFSRYAKTWYFALCVEFHLDTGYNIVPIADAAHYHRSELRGLLSLHEEMASNRLCTNIWLFYLRISQYETAREWHMLNISKFHFDHMDQLLNTLTTLKLLEGQNISLVYTIESRNYGLYMIENCNTNIVMKELKFAFRECHEYHKCLFKMLMIYNSHIKNIKYSNIGKLEKWRALAEKRKQYLIHDFIKYTMDLWSKKLSVDDEVFWVVHADRDNYRYWEDNSSDGIHQYSLPLPMVEVIF